MKVLIKALYPYLFIFLLILIPLDSYARALPNILLIILGICFIYVVTKQDLLKCNNPILYVFICFILFITFSAYFQNRLDTDFAIIKKMLLSLAIFILYIPIDTVQKIKDGILTSSVIIIVASLVKMFFEYMSAGTFDLGNTQFAANALITERLYLGLLSTMSIVISVSSLTKRYQPQNKYQLANIILQTAFIILITSRIAIITLTVLFLVYQLYANNVLKKILRTAFFIVVLLVGAFVVNNNLSKRFLFSTPYESQLTFVEKVKRWEPRMVIWSCVFSIAEKQSLFSMGLGAKNLQNNLAYCYDETITIDAKRAYFLKEKFNTHNQFFDIFLSHGLLPLVLFISFCVWLFVKGRKEFYKTAFIIIFLLFSLVENIFHRQMGAYYFGIFLIILLLTPIEPIQKRTTITNE